MPSIRPVTRELQAERLKEPFSTAYTRVVLAACAIIGVLLLVDSSRIL